MFYEIIYVMVNNDFEEEGNKGEHLLDRRIVIVIVILKMIFLKFLIYICVLVHNNTWRKERSPQNQYLIFYYVPFLNLQHFQQKF